MPRQPTARPAGWLRFFGGVALLCGLAAVVVLGLQAISGSQRASEASLRAAVIDPYLAAVIAGDAAGALERHATAAWRGRATPVAVAANYRDMVDRLGPFAGFEVTKLVAGGSPFSTTRYDLRGHLRFGSDERRLVRFTLVPDGADGWLIDETAPAHHTDPGGPW